MHAERVSIDLVLHTRSRRPRDSHYKDPTLGYQGLVEKVMQLKKEIPSVHVLDQFHNAANPEAHFKWTGPEIWKDTAGKVDVFVLGSGLGSTLSVVGKYLKMKNPNVKIICVEPVASAVISETFAKVIGE